MRIFVICSKKFYDRVPAIKQELEALGHQVFMPNCMNDPKSEEKAKAQGSDAHMRFKQQMYKQSEQTIRGMDAVLTLNFDKDGQQGYIGGATFLEMYDAFRHGTKIFMWNDIPEGILADEIHGFSPVIIKGDLKLIA